MGLLTLIYASSFIFCAPITYTMIATEQAAFLEVLKFIAVALLFVGIGSWLASLLRLQRPNSAKLHTYESGEESAGSAWKRFNTRFYVIAIVFMIFEAETVLLYPWTTVWADPALNEATGGLWTTYYNNISGTFCYFACIGFCLCLEKRVSCSHLLSYFSPPPHFTSQVTQALYDRVNNRYASAINKETTQTNN